MNENRYAMAGWFALAAAIMTLPLMGASIALDVLFEKTHHVEPLFAGVYLLFGLAQAALLLVALYRFRAFLVEQFGYRRANLLILLIIVGVALVSSVGLLGRWVLWSAGEADMRGLFVTGLFAIGVPLGILTVALGIRLLELGDESNTLMRPFAYLNIVGGLCFATIVLAPVGLLIGAVGDALMGLMLLGRGEAVQPEFV